MISEIFIGYSKLLNTNAKKIRTSLPTLCITIILQQRAAFSVSAVEFC